ncbi:hypothetical protein DQ353_10265 [Arthrobacter sp. AQ5-05]|uniref:hypothetical protein n=1 Tax=Arthrobacter sp. AQ5-05 TaxID=2184581 RepID=UPI000DCC1BD5|nr:hypothetical protein [Arthrobacter sp. AQ5-05]RAX49410.1 hypothetical protein DQ353_10265 [Arthrobacter sp. AQ5-05]
MPAHLVLTVHPHWLGAWFLRMAARPVVVVNDIEHAACRGSPCKVALPAGRHSVAAGIRYRGTEALLGACPARITMADDEDQKILATNGMLNHKPFRITAA